MTKPYIVWESCGYYPLFAIPLKSHHYVLYSDSISVQNGISVQKTQSVKLHNIVSKEMSINPIERIFHCGRIKLITWGRTVPDLELRVKNPQEVYQLIEETMEQDHQDFLARRERKKFT